MIAQHENLTLILTPNEAMGLERSIGIILPEMLDQEVVWVATNRALLELLQIVKAYNREHQWKAEEKENETRGRGLEERVSFDEVVTSAKPN